MKKWKNYFLAVIAAICMLWIFPEHTPAATNEAVISVEKGTLGQGYIIEPTASDTSKRRYRKNSYRTSAGSKWQICAYDNEQHIRVLSTGNIRSEQRRDLNSCVCTAR